MFFAKSFHNQSTNRICSSLLQTTRISPLQFMTSRQKPTFCSLETGKHNFAKEEENILLYWRKIDAFKQQLKKSEGKKPFTFYEFSKNVLSFELSSIFLINYKSFLHVIKN